MITSKVLFDTNVLVYHQNKDDFFYQYSRQSHQKVWEGKITGVIASQNFLELSAVLTNTHPTKYPLSIQNVASEIEKYLKSGFFKIIYPNSDTLNIYLDLIRKYRLSHYRKIFDVFLVATMLSNDVNTILTANVKDFNFAEIKTIDLTAVK